jgi:hypothetical protein
MVKKSSMLALVTGYIQAVAIGIEESQISKAIGPFLYEQMIANNNFASIVPLKHMGLDKLG